MRIENRNSKVQYSAEFKEQAVGLANEIGTSRAAEKLGINKVQALSAWIRYSRKNKASAKTLEEFKAENKKLKKELDKKEKVIGILKHAAAFFCQDQQR